MDAAGMIGWSNGARYHGPFSGGPGGQIDALKQTLKRFVSFRGGVHKTFQKRISSVSF
jgi:hypothetical protein